MNKEQYRVKLIHDCYRALIANRDISGVKAQWLDNAVNIADKLLEAHPWPEGRTEVMGPQMNCGSIKIPEKEMTAKQLVERVLKRVREYPSYIYLPDLERIINEEAGL